MSNDEKKIANFPLFKILTVVIIVCAIIIAILFTSRTLHKPSVETVVSSILNDEKVISELSTLEVPYAGIYQEFDEKNNTHIRSIAYSGLVTYGIDFSEIIPTTDNDNKTILLSIPDVRLFNVYVRPDSLRSIPEGKLSELQDRLQNCKKDLENKFIDDEETQKLAIDSTVDTLINFFTPIINSIDSEYKLQIKFLDHTL